MITKILIIFGLIFLAIFLGFTLLIGFIRRVFGVFIPSMAPKQGTSFSFSKNFSFGKNPFDTMRNTIAPEKEVLRSDADNVVLRGEAKETPSPSPKKISPVVLPHSTIKDASVKPSSPNSENEHT